MATNRQIIEALRVVRNSYPTSSNYIGVHRDVVSISNGHSVMRSDIREISDVIRDGDGNVDINETILVIGDGGNGNNE